MLNSDRARERLVFASSSCGSSDPHCGLGGDDLFQNGLVTGMRLNVDQPAFTHIAFPLGLYAHRLGLQLGDPKFGLTGVDLYQDLVLLHRLSFRHVQLRHPAGDATANGNQIGIDPGVVLVDMGHALVNFDRRPRAARNDDDRRDDVLKPQTAAPADVMRQAAQEAPRGHRQISAVVLNLRGRLFRYRRVV